jgi:hypothetical protein
MVYGVSDRKRGIYIHAYIHTYIHTHIHTYIPDDSTLNPPVITKPAELTVKPPVRVIPSLRGVYVSNI